jgi:ComF family protein
MHWLKSIGSNLKLDRLVNAIGDSLWQANCPLCTRPADGILCKDCDRQITAYQSTDFLQKDYPISSSIPLYSWGIYDGALKRAIATCKYDNHPEIMEAIATKISDIWKRSTESQKIMQTFPKLSVIPIPLHANKLKSRGFNQAEVLAKRFCELSNLSCNTQLLQRVKDTKAQMQTKSSKERIENLARAFTVPSQHNSNQRNIILFDDIYTTGATIREAIATLANHQINTCAVIVLARPQFQLPKQLNYQ